MLPTIAALGAALASTAIAFQPQHPLINTVPSNTSVVRCVPLYGSAAALVGEEVLRVTDALGVDLWTENPHLSRTIDVRVGSQEQVAELERQLRLVCSPWIDADTLAVLSAAGAMPFAHDAEAARAEPLQFFTDYRPFDDLVRYVRDLAAQHPDLTRFVPTIGTTHNGRQIPVIHITSRKNNHHAAGKKVIWINGGIHAREWISSHTAVFIIHSLLTLYGRDDKITYLLDNLEFAIAPHINPDGYEYARQKNRMWRKNRRHNGGSSYGVDLNRNFDVRWGQGGSSSSPSSDSYMGPYAASEPETQAVSNYVPHLNASVGIDLHSYSQLLMRPWGNSMDDHPNEAMNKKLGDGMSRVIKAFSGSSYTSQKSAGLYPVTGGLDDWLTTQNMIGFTFELRDRGRYGFVLPKEQIIPTGQEIVEAIKFLGPFVVENL